MSCEECRAALDNDSKHLARDIETAFPGCHCERYSIGEGSPGQVGDSEILYRLFVDPVDVDVQGRLSLDAFSTAYTNGLSIIRDCSDDENVRDLAIDILSVKPGKKLKSILAIYRFECSVVRREAIDVGGSQTRSFCVYDQTVPRVFAPNAPCVPTHAIVLSRRLLGTQTKRQFETDSNIVLRRLIAANPIPVSEFRRGMIEELNARSLQGEFIRNGQIKT